MEELEEVQSVTSICEREREKMVTGEAGDARQGSSNRAWSACELSQESRPDHSPAWDTFYT